MLAPQMRTKFLGKQKNKLQCVYTRLIQPKVATWLQESWWILPTIFGAEKKKHDPTASPGPPLSTKAGSFLHWLVLKGWWLVVPRSEKYDGQIGSCRIRGENNTYA